MPYPYIENLDSLVGEDKFFITEISEKKRGYRVFWQNAEYAGPDWLRFWLPENDEQDLETVRNKEGAYGPKVHLSIPRVDFNKNNSAEICSIIVEELIRAGIKLFKILPPNKWTSTSAIGKEVTIYDVQDSENLIKAIKNIERCLSEEGYPVDGQPLKDEIKVSETKIAYWRDDSTVLEYYADSRALPRYRLSPAVYSNLNNRPPILPGKNITNEGEEETSTSTVTEINSTSLMESLNQQFSPTHENARVKRSLLLQEILNPQIESIFRDLFIGVLPEETNEIAMYRTLE